MLHAIAFYALSFSILPEQKYASGVGACSIPQAGIVANIDRDLPLSPEECRAECSKDPKCLGYETDVYTPAQEQIVVSSHPAGAAITANSCEIHYDAPTYTQITGVFLGDVSFDFGPTHNCFSKAPAEAAGGMSMFERSFNKPYATAVGACRTASGGVGTINSNSPDDPVACGAKCSADPSCVGYEIDWYTADEREIVRSTHPSGEAITENYCEIHYEPLAYAQRSGIMAGDLDFAPNHQCFYKVSLTH